LLFVILKKSIFRFIARSFHQQTVVNLISLSAIIHKKLSYLIKDRIRLSGNSF
jgi:hypothetical protein